MQHMPDKDFDKLFKDKFMDAEIEPSADLWNKIETQLAPKRKRTLPIYWMAAASVAITFTAILVFQKTDKVQLHPDEATVSISKPVERVLPKASNEIITTPVQEKGVSESNFAATKVTSTKLVQVATIKNNEEPLQPSTTLARLPIKQADPKPIDVLPTVSVESPTVIAQVAPQQKNENEGIELSKYQAEGTTEDRRGNKKGLFAFVGRVKEKIDKTTRNIITEKDGVVSIDLGLVTLQKDIN